MIGPNAIIKKSKDMPWRMIEEEAILVDVNKSEVIYLNEVSAQIWKKIAESDEIFAGDIVSFICEEFIVDEGVAKKDVLEFLEQLAQKGVISYQEDT